jgi:hypothetical protein
MGLAVKVTASPSKDGLLSEVRLGEGPPAFTCWLTTLEHTGVGGPGSHTVSGCRPAAKVDSEMLTGPPVGLLVVVPMTTPLSRKLIVVLGDRNVNVKLATPVALAVTLKVTLFPMMFTITVLVPATCIPTTRPAAEPITVITFEPVVSLAETVTSLGLAVSVTDCPTVDGLGKVLRVKLCPKANPAERQSSANNWMTRSLTTPPLIGISRVAGPAAGLKTTRDGSVTWPATGPPTGPLAEAMPAIMTGGK